MIIKLIIKIVIIEEIRKSRIEGDGLKVEKMTLISMIREVKRLGVYLFVYLFY